MSDILTETEAKTRWCPHARVWETDIVDEVGFAAAVNRMSLSVIGTQAYCLGSGCMAWRSVPSASPAGETKGYCGAFGRPAGA